MVLCNGNGEILQRMINEEERVTDIDMNYESEKPQPQENIDSKIKKVLGVKCDIAQDEFVFNFSEMIAMTRFD